MSSSHPNKDRNDTASSVFVPTDPIRESIQQEIEQARLQEALQATVNDYLPGTSSVTDPDTFRQIKFSFCEPAGVDNSNRFLHWLASEDGQIARRGISTIDFKSFSDIANVSFVGQTLSRIENIQDVKWSCGGSIPEYLLRILESKHPRCRLSYNIDSRQYEIGSMEEDYSCRTIWDRTHKPWSGQWGHCPSSTILHSMKMKIDYGSQPDTKKMSFVQNLLETCPNIKELDLEIVHSGCVVGDGQPYSFDLSDLRPFRKFAQLEKLKLTGYMLDDKPCSDEWTYTAWQSRFETVARWPVSRLPRPWLEWIGIRNLRGLGLTKEVRLKTSMPDSRTIARTNLEAWLDRMDWSGLRSFETDRITAESLSLLNGKVPNLTSLVIIDNHNRSLSDAVQWFIANQTRSLESLNLERINPTSTTAFIDTLCRKHSQIRKLMLVDGSRGRYYTEYNTELNLNDTHIKMLGTWCPNLESLTFTSSNSTAEPTLLQALSQIHSLKHLELHFPAPPLIATKADPPDWQTGTSTANEVDEQELFRLSGYYEDTPQIKRARTQFNETHVTGIWNWLKKHKLGEPLESFSVKVERLRQGRPYDWLGGYWMYRCGTALKTHRPTYPGEDSTFLCREEGSRDYWYDGP